MQISISWKRLGPLGLFVFQTFGEAAEHSANWALRSAFMAEFGYLGRNVI